MEHVLYESNAFVIRAEKNVEAIKHKVHGDLSKTLLVPDRGYSSIMNVKKFINCHILIIIGTSLNAVLLKLPLTAINQASTILCL